MVLAPNFVIVGANTAYLKVTGRTLASIVGRSIFDAFPSPSAESDLMLRESLDRAVRLRVRDELPLIRYALIHETPEGRVTEERFWSATHTPLFDNDGALKYVMQHTEDVTELQRLRAKTRKQASALEGAGGLVHNRILKRAEAVQQRNDVLAAEAGQLRQLFSQAPGFIAVVRGPRHVYEIANAAFGKLIGHEDVIGKTMRQASPEVEGQGLFELLDRVYATGEPQVLRNRSVYLLQPETGGLEERFIDVVYQPVCDKEGMVTGIFIQGTDITDQRRAEIELLRHRDELEQLVAERTEALRKSDVDRLAMQAALHQSQKMEALGKLTGGVAHDFNNALQIIAGNLHLLRRTVSTDEQTQRRLEGALGGVERGAKLASHLLAFARKQPLAPVVLNTGRLLRDIDDLLRRTLGETIELETVVAGGIWNTLVDRNFLENALLNLAINARDAMQDQGQGRLTIEAGNASLDDNYARTHAEVVAGQYVMIAISDTGSGMTEDVVQKVFEPFFTTKPEGHGTGLGLSMVYGFVKQSGGHIKIYSEPGHGTTVRLYLPRSVQTEDATAPLVLIPALGGSETILVVEDDAQVRETVVDMLTDLGYKVLKASDAKSALAVVESGVPIDLLFTDVVMPGTLRSPELARRARIAQPLIEVLFTSGYTENAIVHGGRLDPGVALLSKPYPREELARKIRHILSNRRHASGLQAEVDDLSEQNLAGDRASRNMPSLRILVVEDDAASLASTLEILEHLGHRPTGVASAELALESLAETPFEVLMTDVNLPGISGDVLGQRAVALHPALQVVFASGMSGVETGIAQAFWLPKPFGTEQISNVLQRVAAGAVNGIKGQSA